MKNGFSLLELLLVLAVLALLISAMLVGLNPLEQLRKSRDVGKLSKAKEVFTAAEGHYAFYQVDPTCSDLITVQVLKTGSCDNVTLSGSNGNYQVTFDAQSKAYQDKCGGIICTVPDDF